MSEPGQIIILNGAPRSGKSSIVQAVQESFEGPWMNLGVDTYEQVTPLRCRPGIGLRPGGERPDIEGLVPRFYAALYESIAAHSRVGLNVVADLGHHDSYSRPLDCLVDCAQRLAGLPVLFVGVRCPIEIIMQRRADSPAGRGYVTGSPDDPVPLAVRLWQEEVHRPGVYDLEVDTSLLTPAQCADAIRGRLRQNVEPPTAFERLLAFSANKLS
ncbi:MULTISPECIES: chloramphenicol phosphotransferase CPT family protein [unclassified Mesorhizobium]|uniref:chloramphenicol phosphotransferase CPT family protein n=1 Tax=unclassified Mesorhizobium TaxID=325217 RepID=UPI00112C67BE|nr:MULTISPECIES: chloramphenicol phosphotransferase [unclassified Mesorhizobium]TPJ46431.1 chloramphenicol phosphotransferase [Mesorhizobium sp. B2-6-6]MCA0003463.1 chloramphenicol phosphotransferase [Mesorhizobium sp. B264B2A]MCA0009808.1 chloramphenicol phosphotransferase [Mesorhizobium sp. B264B1B]MCA0020199.1 chloramphenicol phosphotransferase [Mesorhizobium sp. B264B1A]TPK56999.1 chloramphenicol phosphotransferase [Mesorhizobium sp. B2-5-2]